MLAVKYENRLVSAGKLAILSSHFIYNLIKKECNICLTKKLALTCWSDGKMIAQNITAIQR